MEGTPFGRYRLMGLLRRGAMGEVWRAYDPSIDRVVALKMLPPIFADDQVFRERFRREARAAAGLDEPHVVPVHDFGEADGRLFVTMQLIKGRDLDTLLDEGPLPPKRAVGIIEGVASALQAAHEVGLVHRDVKPSNIIVARDDFAYLIDFGIARAVGETRLTDTGSTIGTWAYMAPERFRSGVSDKGADIYGLTCVLYQALTGEVPFVANTHEHLAAAHMFLPPPKPSKECAAVSKQMDEVIATGMAKEPKDRYTSAKDLARAARAALGTPSTDDPALRREGAASQAAAVIGTADGRERHATAPWRGQGAPGELALRSVARADRGLDATRNEDSVYAGAWLLAVADGWGYATGGGDAASQLIITALADLDEGPPGEDFLSKLDDGIRAGNAAIAAQVKISRGLQAIGTTVTAILFAGNRLGLAHIGDSRAYLLRDGRLTQITRDDTLAQARLDQGLITAEAALHETPGSRLTRNLTGHSGHTSEPTLTTRDVVAGDRYLLCSDGLSDYVSDEMIRRVLQRPELGPSADNLILLALRAGGFDNVSVVLADVVEPGR